MSRDRRQSVVTPARALPGESTPTRLTTRWKSLRLPVFVPDATRAAIRSVPTSMLRGAGVEAVIVSTAHLATQPGTSVVSALGGLRALMGWDGPVLSDSGGFQVFSLMTSGRGLATVSDAGLSYRFSPKHRYRQLTPKSCIETQLRLGSDIMYCLDYCTHPNAAAAEQDRSVELTVRWAAECRSVFDRLVADVPPPERPLLFAVIQGGADPARRARCAQALADIGFDGYGFGGYPIVDGRLVEEVAQVAELAPPGAILHGLGIGTPENLVSAWRAGYVIFDCTLPTRNARRGVVYTGLNIDAAERPGLYRVARMGDERWSRQRTPVDPDCDCEMCRLPAGYIAHLFRLEEPLAGTLASVHNLRFYSRLTDALRARRDGAEDQAEVMA
ncbi:MAG: queuine tRNA-ribosyltransferase family protein [Actinomycetota bacterium]|nr:queuine tRNA-ribosyltransferase family protein [Actinomycetota bacterium]